MSSVPANATTELQPLIDEIRPYLQGDGGDCELIDVDDEGVVHLRFAHAEARDREFPEGKGSLGEGSGSGFLGGQPTPLESWLGSLSLFPLLRARSRRVVDRRRRAQRLRVLAEERLRLLSSV